MKGRIAKCKLKLLNIILENKKIYIDQVDNEFLDITNLAKMNLLTYIEPLRPDKINNFVYSSRVNLGYLNFIIHCKLFFKIYYFILLIWLVINNYIAYT